MDHCKRIFLWSGPRNISTTLMYSFAQRDDTIVFDEPLYGAYLIKTNAKEYHPDADLIIESMECNAEKVVDMMCGPHSKNVAFFKNMTHHLMDMDRSFLKNGFNVILTRDPKEMLPSFDKVISNPGLGDVGYKDHAELVQYFKSENIPYLILDSKKVLQNPEEVLTKLCRAIGIPFISSMLSWEAGPRAEDGVWAKHWYANIHRSEGFLPYSEKTTPFPEHLNKLLEECRIYYQPLREKAL